MQISAKAKDYVTVQTKRLSVPVNLHRYNQIADLTIHPQRIPGDVDEIHAFIHFFTSSNRNESALQIPFYSRVLHGSLDYVRTETMFDMSLWKKQRSTAEISKCHSVHVVNRFSTNIAVLNISSSHSGKLDDYVQVRDLFFVMDGSIISVGMDLGDDAGVLRISSTESTDVIVLSHSSSPIVGIEIVQQYSDHSEYRNEYLRLSFAHSSLQRIPAGKGSRESSERERRVLIVPLDWSADGSQQWRNSTS